MSIPDNLVIEMKKELDSYVDNQGIDLEQYSIENVDNKDIIIGYIMVEIASSSFFDLSQRELSQRLVEKLS